MGRVLSGYGVLCNGSSIAVKLQERRVVHSCFRKRVPRIAILSSPKGCSLCEDCLRKRSLFTTGAMIIVRGPFFVGEPPGSGGRRGRFGNFVGMLGRLAPSVLTVFAMSNTLSGEAGTSGALLSIYKDRRYDLLTPQRNTSIVTQVLVSYKGQIRPRTQTCVRRIVNS